MITNTVLDIARAEVLDVIQSHTEIGGFRPRYGPESEAYTKKKRQHLATIHNDLADQWGYKRLKEI